MYIHIMQKLFIILVLSECIHFFCELEYYAKILYLQRKMIILKNANFSK